LYKDHDDFRQIMDYYNGYMKYNDRDYEGAIEYFKGVPDSIADSLMGFVLIGQTYENVGDIKKAVEYYMKLMTKNMCDMSGLMMETRARILNLKPSIDKKLEPIRALSEENPSNLNLRARLAIELDEYGRFDEALSTYKEIESMGAYSGANRTLIPA